MSIVNPTQLVEEFKKSGEFDRLRRELLTEFRNGEGFASFMSRVEDITRSKLASDGRLLSMSESSLSRELNQELNRYPLVERAVAESPSLSDPTFVAAIREHVNGILREDRTGSKAIKAPVGHQTSTLESSAPQLSLTTRTQPTETRSSSQVPTTGDRRDRRTAQSRDTQSAGMIDGNESDNSAMLESPLSDKQPSEGLLTNS